MMKRDITSSNIFVDLIRFCMFNTTFNDISFTDAHLEAEGWGGRVGSSKSLDNQEGLSYLLLFYFGDTLNCH
jgi:hypothetical protein